MQIAPVYGLPIHVPILVHGSPKVSLNIFAIQAAKVGIPLPTPILLQNSSAIPC